MTRPERPVYYQVLPRVLVRSLRISYEFSTYVVCSNKQWNLPDVRKIKRWVDLRHKSGSPCREQRGYLPPCPCSFAACLNSRGDSANYSSRNCSATSCKTVWICLNITHPAAKKNSEPSFYRAHIVILMLAGSRCSTRLEDATHGEQFLAAWTAGRGEAVASRSTQQEVLTFRLSGLAYFCL